VNTPENTVIIIAGPTASGKSACAMEVAQKRNGVIINADSMQIYDALPLLTAQPGPDDMNRVQHVLYAALPPKENCSAQSWREMALKEIETAFKNGKTPVVTGGTGFYIKALMQGLSPIPDVPVEIRARMAARQKETGNPAFHTELAKLDPGMAARLNPNDTQRLIRAREVLEATGKSLSWWQSLPPATDETGYHFDVRLIMPERADLYSRCDTRFEAIMAQGALDEVSAFCKRLDDGTVPQDAAITHALGFRPLRRYLGGEIKRDEAITLAKAETRQYAKRQVTWFRHQIAK